MQKRTFLAAGVAELEARRLMTGPGTMSPAALADVARVVADQGLMVAVHAAGDAAVQADLAAFEKALGASGLAAGEVATFDQSLTTGLGYVEADWSALAKAAPTLLAPANPAAINAGVNILTTQTDNLGATLGNVEAAYEATNPSQAAVGLMLRLDAEVAAVAPMVEGFRVDMTALNDQLAGGPNLAAELANLKVTASNAAGLAGDMAATLKDEADLNGFAQLIGSSTLPAAAKAQFLAGFLKQMAAVDLDMMGVARVDHSNDTLSTGVQLNGSVATDEAATLLFNAQGSLANLVNTAEAAYLKAGGTATATITRVNDDTTALAADVASLAARFQAGVNHTLSARGTALLTTINAEKATVAADVGAGSNLVAQVAAFRGVLAGTSVGSQADVSLGIGAALANLTADITGNASTSLGQSVSPAALGMALNKTIVDKAALDFWLTTAEAELQAIKLPAASSLIVARLQGAMGAFSADLALMQTNMAKLPGLATS